MSLHDSLKEICEGLRSARQTDRKKNGDALKSYLMRNAVPSLLTENSLNKTGYTWNDVFDDINDYIIKELEKYETSKTFQSVIEPLCTSLLHLCVAGSNKGQAYIKCEKLMEACLNILKDNRLANAIGDAYLSLLYKYVLPCEHYFQRITPSTWEELLDVGILACIKKYSKLDDFTKLRLLLLVVNSGRNNCQFVIPMRDSLSKFMKLFLEVPNDKKAQEVIVEITISLLETLSSEYRLSMCHFVESILSLVLKLYDQNQDQKKKSLIFTMLHACVVLHHPSGRLRSQEGSLAADWDIWNKHVYGMLEIIYMEVNCLQKVSRQNINGHKHCNSFYYLTASVYFQIFNQLDATDYDHESSSTKRQKLTNNKIKIFGDLIDEFQQNHIPWLGIVKVFVKDYSYYVSGNEYSKVVNVIESLITKNNTTLDWDILEELAILVLTKYVLQKKTKVDDNNVLNSLWNSCVRNSTSLNSSHKLVHMIMQYLLKNTEQGYQNVQPLIKLYLDCGMPVSDFSIKTLCVLFQKFFIKCNFDEIRIKCFTWFIQGDIKSASRKQIQALTLRLLGVENMSYIFEFDTNCDKNIYDTLFNSIEDCILFSDFENNPKPASIQENKLEHIEINAVIAKHIQQYFTIYLQENLDRFKNNDIELLTFIKIVEIVISFFDISINHSFSTTGQVEETVLFGYIKTALKDIFLTLQSILTSNTQIAVKIKYLQLIRDLLEFDLNPLLSTEIRMSIDDNLFHYLNNIIHTEIKIDDEDVLYDEDDELVGAVALKHHCIYTLAAFCIKLSNYRAELLDLILDPKTYNFTYDINCALQCIEILSSSKVEQHPLGLMFTLMAHMCRCLYRDSIASYGILKILINMIDTIWLQDCTMKQNCYIMIKSYFHRCEKLFYTPKVAALIYECGAKITALSRKYNDGIDNIFEKALVEKTKGDVHSIRLYSCYLLSTMLNYVFEEDIDTLCTNINDLFLINVPNRQELILKDELTNRTSTALHLLLAVAAKKKSLISRIVNRIIYLQKEKSFNKELIKKVLNKVVSIINVNNIESYLDRNILCFLYFWFTKNYNFVDTPFHLFGYDTLDKFTERHKTWLISAYMLWCKKGNIKSINLSQELKIKEPLENILENCFCNIIAICLPYMAVEKYNIDCMSSELPNNFKQYTVYAKQMFQLTGQILPSEKWTNLFVENLSKLLLLTTIRLCDQVETKIYFQIDFPEEIRTFYYPKKVYLGILNFMGDLTDGDIMLYLCENQPLGIYQVLFHMWENVTNENVLELIALAIHAYITFIENIPMGHSSDAFIWNFICYSFEHAIKECSSKDELSILAKGITLLLDMLLPKLSSAIVQKPLSHLLSTLIMKREDKHLIECEEVLSLLVHNIKKYLKTNEDVVDFITSLSQNVVVHERCFSMCTFLEKMRTFKLAMICPSYETLLNMRQFLKTNKQHVRASCNNLDQTIFSEDCGLSILHQIIHFLTTIITSASDNKIIIEACNCLSDLETYDLKSLVTVPPNETRDVVNFNPKLCFAVTCVKSLTKNLFDKDPNVTNKTAKTLNSVLKYFENIDILDMEELEKHILKSLSPLVNTMPLDIKLNSKAFNSYHSKCTKGIFLTALTTDWPPDGNENQFDWLKQVTSTIVELIEWGTDCVINVQQVCTSKVKICEDILPALVGLLIYCSTEQQIQIIGEQINLFFNYIWDKTFNNIENAVSDCQNIIKKTSSLDHFQKSVVQYMLNIVDFVRLQRNYYKSRPNRAIESLNYLKLQYDRVAWAATVADQNLAAIFYGELWAVSQNNGVPPPSPECTTNLNGGENVQQIFRKCYVSIGEMDAIDGCGTAHLTLEDEKRKHLINTGQFTDALFLHDIALSCSTQNNYDLHCGVVRSLHKSGMYHLALQYIKSLPENETFDDISYECLSFLGDWTGFVDIRALEDKFEQIETNPQSLLKALHYACLKDCLNVQINTNSENKMTELMNIAKRATSKLCQNLNMENCQSVYTVVSKLRLFTDIEDYFYVRSAKTSIDIVLNGWHVENLPPYNDFTHLEALISQRILMLEHASHSFKEFNHEILSLQIQYARLGLSNNRIQMVQRLVALMKESKPFEEIAFVESEISWAKGHHEIALSLLRNVVNRESTNVTMRAMSSRQYGLWMAESKHENARDIINKYLLKSLAVLKNNDHAETRMKVYYDIAKFADSEYKQVVLYMNSTVFENKVKCLESLRGTTSSLRSTQQSLSRDEKKALHVNDRFREMDEAEIASTKAEKESFLQLAMRYYLLSLKHCEDNNLSVFRVISLWLDNPKFEFEDEQGNNYADSLRSIPSRKFITVLPQIAPHLTTQTSSFVKNLKEIIKRCAVEHPHHTLPILFSLKNSDKDKVIMNASGTAGRGATKTRVQEPRVVAADVLVQELKKQNKDLGVIISQMDKMCNAIISLANYKPSTKETKQNIPSAEQIHKLKDLDAICVPTVTISISKDNKYSNLPALHCFENYFELVGGINCPKKITCTDSTGKKRILLIKGEDDLRQDAVMQQVFNIVNNLLEKNPVTSRNKLRIRTYRVVPMSRQSGVLEWCVGTIPLGMYLIGVGNSGAHARYRPQDISCSAARKKIAECHEARKSNKEKLIVFTKILRDFKPVFHYFFTEHYANPVSWYERRLAYTKSVATSSMVGYILGLGDRHVQNILIDKRTGEVIHIDFGIAFDQGKTLPTPETVPFRLTQDIVAGFGSSGVEGIFRRSCEKTMQLLHDSQEILLTILEVLLCDPLYTWTLTTAPEIGTNSRNANNHCTTGSDSGLAKRALLTVSSKLNGTEGGLAGGVAVAGQVARLLQAATDPANLSRLFPGWQPYL